MSGLMDVWRIEGPDGDGPYIGHEVAGMNAVHRDTLSTPNPQNDEFEDGNWGIESYEVCGFASPDRLIDWFTTGGDWLAKMADADKYVMVRDTVPRKHVRIGRHQLVYNKDERVDRRSTPISPGWVAVRLEAHRYGHDVKSTSKLNEEQPTWDA